MDIVPRPLSHIQEKLNEGTLSCTGLVREFLASINSNAHLNVFLSVYPDEALKQAERIDRKIKRGSAGKLAGLVVGIKDVLAHEGHTLTAASKILGDFKAPYQSTVVDRLVKEDAIIIGRQNCDEFGMGSSTENSAFGPVLNPLDPKRTPGGSSGGSAAAVAAGLCSISIGSDTGGSVRQPAAFCGVYGLKPTYGRISRHGLVAFASSFDTVGIVGRHLDDIASVLSVVSGQDGLDSTASKVKVPDYAIASTRQMPFRVAVIRNVLKAPGLQDEVRESLQRAVRRLHSLGHLVEEVEFPLLEHNLPAYYLLSTAEASSNLSRYDGVRYGHRTSTAETPEDLYKKSRTEGFGKEAKRRIMLGTFVLSADYHNAYYIQAQKVRRLIREETAKILSAHDVILIPTTPTTAFPLGSVSNPLSMYLGDIFSVQANVAGVPALSFPYGRDRHGLPIGLQVLARDFQEDRLLAFARLFAVDR